MQEGIIIGSNKDIGLPLLMSEDDSAKQNNAISQHYYTSQQEVENGSTNEIGLAADELHDYMQWMVRETCDSEEQERFTAVPVLKPKPDEYNEDDNVNAEMINETRWEKIHCPLHHCSRVVNVVRPLNLSKKTLYKDVLQAHQLLLLEKETHITGSHGENPTTNLILTKIPVIDIAFQENELDTIKLCFIGTKEENEMEECPMQQNVLSQYASSSICNFLTDLQISTDLVKKDRDFSLSCLRSEQYLDHTNDYRLQSDRDEQLGHFSTKESGTEPVLETSYTVTNAFNPVVLTVHQLKLASSLRPQCPEEQKNSCRLPSAFESSNIIELRGPVTIVNILKPHPKELFSVHRSHAAVENISSLRAETIEEVTDTFSSPLMPELHIQNTASSGSQSFADSNCSFGSGSAVDLTTDNVERLFSVRAEIFVTPAILMRTSSPAELAQPLFKQIRPIGVISHSSVQSTRNSSPKKIRDQSKTISSVDNIYTLRPQSLVEINNPSLSGTTSILKAYSPVELINESKLYFTIARPRTTVELIESPAISSSNKATSVLNPCYPVETINMSTGQHHMESGNFVRPHSPGEVVSSSEAQSSVFQTNIIRPHSSVDFSLRAQCPSELICFFQSHSTLDMVSLPDEQCSEVVTNYLRLQSLTELPDIMEQSLVSSSHRSNCPSEEFECFSKSYFPIVWNNSCSLESHTETTNSFRAHSPVLFVNFLDSESQNVAYSSVQKSSVRDKTFKETSEAKLEIDSNPATYSCTEAVNSDEQGPYDLGTLPKMEPTSQSVAHISIKVNASIIPQIQVEMDGSRSQSPMEVIQPLTANSDVKNECSLKASNSFRPLNLEESVNLSEDPIDSPSFQSCTEVNSYQISLPSTYHTDYEIHNEPKQHSSIELFNAHIDTESRNLLQVPEEEPCSSTELRMGDSSTQSSSAAQPSYDEMDLSSRLHKPSWLRASMRRVTHFQLTEPPTLLPLATADTVLDILESNRRPTSAPGGGGFHSRRSDFPRRYSSYSATILNSSSVTNLTQAAEPVAVEPRSSEEDDVEEDVSSSSESSRSPTHHQSQQEIGAEQTEGNPLGEWPHSLSSMLASLGCTLGLFNISRFAIFSVHFGANFIVQFLLLTLALGIPMYTLNTCLGQCLCAGVMDMWHISPIFQGIGIALLVGQAVIGIYSIVGISWMFIYFRDSFITKQDRYRWAEPYQPYRSDTGLNETGQLEQTVPDYLNGIVLQRHSLAVPDSSFGHLKFQVAFNLAVVWMIVFVSLSKGLKSYGKVAYVFSLFPVFGMLVLCTKLLGLMPTNTTHQVFPETVWSEFFFNTKSWIAATTEVFFTWGLLGAAAMQIASHNRHKHLLNRDTSLVVVLTLAVLLLAAFLANTCVAILNSHGYEYIPSSYERMSSYVFLHRSSDPFPPSFTSIPVRYMSQSTLIAGTRVIVPNDLTRSGYQVLRLATELVPSTLALLGADSVSPFWAVLFYFVLILFGIAQQLCIWHCVITGIMAISAVTLKSWETTITFFSCAGGFILGLPMTTELGIRVVYFLDYSIGCAWWIMVIYLLEIIAVFVVRGRPYSGETVVATLFNRPGCLLTWVAPVLIFIWNVILPIALVVMCIAVFKTGHYREFYNWRPLKDEYWTLWARELGCIMQIFPILIILLVCLIQVYRYLSGGPRDILDRIQLLYRPSMSRQDVTPAIHSPTNLATSAPQVTNTPIHAHELNMTTVEDSPPKYTPPPSYTTATGARIAKLLRQSFRRSMRHLTNALSETRNNSPPLPPDYASVLVEINRTLQDQEEQQATPGTSAPVSQTTNLSNQITTLTAEDVAQILRCSFRRNTLQNRNSAQLVNGTSPINVDEDNSPSTRTET